MILVSIKNFFKSIGFYFVPLGVLTFVTVLTFVGLLPQGIGVVKGTFEQIAKEVSSVTFDWNEVSGVIMGKISAYSNDPAALLALFSNSDNLVNLLKEVVQECFGLEAVTANVVTLLQNCVAELSGLIVMLFIMMVLGFFLGFVLLVVLVRQFLSGTNFVKALLMALIDGVIAVAFLFLVLNVKTTNDALFILLIAGILLVSLIISILESYLFFGIKKVKFSKVFNFNNIIALLIGEAIDIALGIGLVALCFLSKNQFVSIFVSVPFILLTVSVLGVNASTYTSNLAKEYTIVKKASKKEETQA